ncbi:MAG: hypothetical protein AAGI49_12865 [Bacteroidota bacterium]
MNKVQILSILVAALLLLNLALIYGLTQRSFTAGAEQLSEEERMEMPRRDGQQLHRQMDFNEAQMERFEASKELHRVKMQKYQQQLRKLSKTYYYLNATDTLDRTALLAEINQVSNNIYQTNARHFDDLRAICTPEQLPKLDRFIGHLISGHQPPKGAKRPPKKREPSQ